MGISQIQLYNLIFQNTHYKKKISQFENSTYISVYLPDAQHRVLIKLSSLTAPLSCL